MHTRPTAFWLLPALCGLLCAAADAGDWPRFRGPNGTGVSDDKDVPVQWSDKDGVLWKTPIPGRGNSSPIVWGDRLFVQSSAADASERWLFCINAESGEVIWKQSAPGGRFGRLNPNNSYASSTPATDGERVYAVFWDGKDLSLTAYDFKGEKVWGRDLGSYESEHGAGISPIVYDGKVYVADDQGASYDTSAPSAVLAFNAKDGSDAWKAPRKSFRASYSTPFILEAEKGKPELIVASTAGVAGYDPANGAEIWNYVWSFSVKPLRTVASPVAAAGLVIANAGEGGRGRSLIAVRPGRGDVTQTNLVWQDERSFSYVPTLLASGDYLYCVNDDGIASCHDAKTGDEVWTHRLTDTHVSSSPVLIDGKIYAINEGGDVFVFEASPKAFHLLAKNGVGEDVMSTPAVSNNRLYIRGKATLFCIGKPGKSTGQ